MLGFESNQSVWWYLSDTICAWESDLFGAEAARLSEREWPVESAERIFVPRLQKVRGQLAAVRAQHPGTTECQQKKENKCFYEETSKERTFCCMTMHFTTRPWRQLYLGIPPI